MIIICDTSPLIALATCGALGLLEKLFDSVYVTPMVYQEICQKDKPHSQQLSEYFADKIYQDLNIEIIGSLGVLLIAKQAGLISEIKPFLDKLVQSPLFFSQNILNHTLSLANELN